MIFSRELSFPEGPVVLPDGSWLIVEMGAGRGCVSHIDTNGAGRKIIAKTGRPNGLAVDARGVIWVAESSMPSLLRITMDGKVEVAATACDGEPFLWPNDLCFGPDGALYFSDSGVRVYELMQGSAVRPDYSHLNWDGRVYRFDPASGAVSKLDSGLRFANGIAFGPNRDLYVNEMISSMVYRYRWHNSDSIGPREIFGNANPLPTAGFQGTDGMAFDEDGKLYVTVFGRGHVAVMDEKSGIIETIPTKGGLPTNIAFGLPGDRRIYVTEDQLGQMEVFDAGVDGLKLYS